MKPSMFAAILVLTLASFACGGNSVPEMATFTPVPNTATPPPTITPLPRPVFTFAPLPFTVSAPVGVTSTPLPPPARINSTRTERVYFAAGATSILLADQIQPGDVFTYLIYVVGKQPAELTLISQNNSTLAVYDPNQREVLSSTNQAVNWKGYFEQAGTYYVSVHGNPATAGQFNLSITIAARVTLEPNLKYAQYKSTTVGKDPAVYAVNGTANQTLTVRLNTSDNAVLVIRGFVDGQTYLHAAAGTTDFTLLLPATQDYIIEVIPEVRNAAYNLFVSLQ